MLDFGALCRFIITALCVETWLRVCATSRALMPLAEEKAETSPTPVAAGPVLQAAAVPPVQSAATPDGNKTVSENPRPRALPDVPAPPSNRWPLTGGAFSSGDGKYSQFASSIKATHVVR